MLCHFIFSIQTTAEKAIFEQTTGCKDMQVKPSFVTIIITKFLLGLEQVLLSGHERIIKPLRRDYSQDDEKTGFKIYDEAGGLEGIVLRSTVTTQSLADRFKAEGLLCPDKAPNIVSPFTVCFHLIRDH